jgi:monoamine oxidase
LAKRIHPQIEEELNQESLITIAWQNIPHIRSPWVAWTPDRYKRWFHQITEPMGSIAFAGDWCSHLPAWQEGAIRSAYSLLAWAGQ